LQHITKKLTFSQFRGSLANSRAYVYKSDTDINSKFINSTAFIVNIGLHRHTHGLRAWNEMILMSQVGPGSEAYQPGWVANKIIAKICI